MHLQLRLLAALQLCFLLMAPAIAAPALWMVKRGDSVVYLFGTVHLLPGDTHWRTPALEQALTASRSLTIELTDDDSVTLQPLVLQYGLDPSHPLSDQLTPAENATLTRAAQTAGVPGGVRTLQVMRPWLGAITLAVAPLIKAGLAPAQGVDKQLKAQMIAAGKPVHGLESAEAQIRFLADLPTKVQLALLRSTLHDTNQGSGELTRLVAAWKTGDIAAIARLEDVDLRQREPQLYQRLLMQRNQAWAGQINAMLQRPGVRLLAVGAAHLAGPDSVQAQLKKIGILAVRQ